MKFTVYILFSSSLQKFYTGQTQDFENRIQEHNSGKTPSIKNGIPWKLVWSLVVGNRSEAMKLESKIKSRGAKRFLEDLSEL
jgi:putative endonuclease